MAERIDELRRLVDAPPAAPEPLEALRRRNRRRTRRRAGALVAAAAVSAIGAVLVLAGGAEDADRVELADDPTAPVDPATSAPAQPEPPPSQTVHEARRDGVVHELAALPLDLRAEELVRLEGGGQTWVIARPAEEVSALTDDGCSIGYPAGEYGIDVVCASEYGEILLLADDGTIERAYPMPGVPPTWLHLTDEAVYAGRTGDGGLPDSTLVRIDRLSLRPTRVLFRNPGGGIEPLAGWHVATEQQVAQLPGLVSVGSTGPGTVVSSWVGLVTVDLAAIDELLRAVTSGR